MIPYVYVKSDIDLSRLNVSEKAVFLSDFVGDETSAPPPLLFEQVILQIVFLMLLNWEYFGYFT